VLWLPHSTGNRSHVDCDVLGRGFEAEFFSEAIFAPSMSDLIFLERNISRRVRGAVLGFTSMLNGEKPRSSVAPSLSNSRRGSKMG
jgi:hypothetical protein